MSDDSTQQISHVGLYDDQFLPDTTTKTPSTTDASVVEKMSLKDKEKYHVTLNCTQKWQNEYLHHLSTKSSNSCLSLTEPIQMWVPIVATPSSYYYIHENTNHHNHSTITFESRDSIIQYNGISLVNLHHLSTQNDKNEKDQIQRFLKTLQQTLKSVVPSSSLSSTTQLKASSLTEIMKIAFFQSQLRKADTL